MAAVFPRPLDRFLQITRRLKPPQAVARIHRAIRPVTVPGRGSDAEADRTRWARGPGYRRPFVWGVFPGNTPREILAGRFTLVGKTLDLGTGGGPARGIRWGADEATVHWKKMLHAFDWLGHLPPEQARGLLRAYVEEMPRDRNDKAWDAWTAAFRVQSVIRWHAEHGADEDLAPAVARWANHVAANLEWRIMGNHLLKDALALSLAGRFLDGPASPRWRRRGDRLVMRLLRTHVLPDGGHEELAPMYHSLILYDLMDLLSCAGPDDEVRPHLERAVRAMATFLRGTIHPDGQIANLNDSGFDIAPAPDILLEKAASLGCAAAPVPPSWREYPDFGVRVIEGGPWWLIFDAGPAALEYLPAHGHADTLTLEASFEGRRLLVDTGVSTYEGGPDRDRERGTGAHNTALIAGTNSSDTYREFRMGRRAYVTGVTGSGPCAAPWVEASHDGYRDLPGAPVHTRRVAVEPPGTLLVRDVVTGGRPHEWEVRWHLAPGWSAAPHPEAPGAWVLAESGEPRVLARCSGGETRVAPARVCLRFGHAEGSSVLICRALDPRGAIEWRFAPLGARDPRRVDVRDRALGDERQGQ